MGVNRQIARAATLVGFLTLCSRIAGLLRDAVIGYLFGAGPVADAFFVAFRIPNLLRRLVGEGAMGAAFVPVFTEYFSNRPRAEAVGAARAVGTVMAATLLLLTALGMFLAPLWVALVAPGFAADSDKLRLTIELTRFLFGYIPLVGLAAVLAALLHAMRHFAVPALSPILLNATVITVALLICHRLEKPALGLAYGVVLGGVLQLFLHVVPLLHRRVSLTPLCNPRHPAVRRVMLLLVPTVFGAAVSQVNVILITILASALPEGSVSSLWYGERILEFPLGLVAVAFGTAALPSFSALAVRREHEQLRRSLVFSVAQTSLVMIPASLGLLVLAEPIVIVLFQRGSFALEQAAMTATAVRAFAVGLWSISTVRLLVPTFYALGDTRTPVLTATAAVIANLLLSFMLMGPVSSDGSSMLLDCIEAATGALGVLSLRHGGLALATSLAATVNLLLLAFVLWRKLGGLEIRRLLGSLGRITAAGVVMALVVSSIGGRIDFATPRALTVKATSLLFTLGVGVFVFILAAVILRVPELLAVWRSIPRRQRMRGK
jgi:putative peptidoglycan lipid II flippase